MSETDTFNRISDRRNLYLISQRTNTQSLDILDAIVAAWSEEEARNINPGHFSGTQYWASPDRVTVKLIGLAEPGVVGVLCVDRR